MHSAYSAVARGSANSAVVVAAPLIHFQINLSFVLSPLFFTSNSDLPAVRQLCGALGHTLDRHVSVPSLHSAANPHGSVPSLHAPLWQVSSPLQYSPSLHDVPSG